MENVFEIVKVTGLGMKECMNVEHSIGLIFHNKIDAEQEADRLWKEQTTEEDRKSGWCALHYIVKVRSIK
jgi:predicted 3-demethylubiquinone-9 3-methyltransferase (glyoxalase superfamily)